MRDISLFGEDAGHEIVLTGLISRQAEEHDIEIKIRSLSSTGGLTKVHHEFGEYLRDVDHGKFSTPDLIVIATDGNCKGYAGRRQEIEKVSEPYPALAGLIVYAIPDPHVERWLLSDPLAFKKVLGRGCNVPTEKCEKDYYKRMLANEVRESGVKPILGGLEYAEDIVANMNFPIAERNDPSLGRVLRELRARFHQWAL